MHPPSPATILEAVSTVYGLPVREITGPTSISNRAYARRCAMYYMATVGGMSNGDIAKVFKRGTSLPCKVRRGFWEDFKYDRWETARVVAVGAALGIQEGVAA